MVLRVNRTSGPDRTAICDLINTNILGRPTTQVDTNYYSTQQGRIMRFVWNSKIVKVLEDYGGGGVRG